MSLSARRAWIEMHVIKCSIDKCCRVALRKESVDRNNGTDNSACQQLIVALRKESVDRNACVGFH